MQRGNVVFTSWLVRFMSSLLPVLVVLIGASNVLESNTRVFGAVALVVGSVLTYRAFRSASVAVGADAVTLHGFLRTRRIEYRDLDRADTNQVLDHGVRARPHLVLYRVDGEVVRFRSLMNRRRNDERNACLVEDAVEAINARIVSANLATS
jgi:hypothetical protein